MQFDASTTTRVDDLLDDVRSGKLDRRQLMTRILATAGAAGLAYATQTRASAQATPGASPAASPAAGAQSGIHMEPYTGDLAENQLLRLAITEPKSMDPGVSTGYDELEVFANIFDGLTGVDVTNGEVVPRIATAWEPNADATEFVFHLRDDVKWTNGNGITANDFVYAWRRVLDPDTMSLYVPAMNPVKNAQAIQDDKAKLEDLGVEAVDDHTLKVTLEASTPYFPLLASTWTYCPVPKDVVDQHAEKWVEAENIVSNGPYKMTEWKHDQSIVLERNDDYYGDKPTITRAEYSVYEDAGTQGWIAFGNNEIDYCWPDTSSVEKALGDPNLKPLINFFDQSNCRMVTCDCSNAPTDNKDFRQALYAAIDRKTLAGTILKDQVSASYNIVPNGIPGANPDAVLPEGEDAAKEAFQKSGVAAGTEIEYTFRAADEDSKKVAEFLQQQWQDKLGLKIKLNPVEPAAWNDYVSSRETQKYHVKYGTWGSDFNDPSNWHNQNFISTADHYRTHWKNDEYDKLCADAAKDLDEASRNQQYQQAEKILVEDASMIPVWRGRAYVATKEYVKNLHMQPILAVVHLRNVKIAKH